MKSKNHLCSSTHHIISLSLLALLIVLWYNPVEGKKIQYGELLTNDNELFLIESAPAPKAPKIQKPPVRRSIVKSSNEAQKLKSGLAGSKKAATKAPNPKTTAENIVDPNKLIVKIVYASANSGVQTQSDLTRLVYSTSESMNSCDKGPCRSNEVCILLEQKSQTGEDYKCVPRSKLASAQIQPTTTRVIRRRSANSQYLTPECSEFVLTLFRLHLFEIFDSGQSGAVDYEATEPTSHAAILALIANLDLNRDGRIDLYEWLKRPEIAAAGKCADALFYKCELDEDRRLSIAEVNKCFMGLARPTCAYIHDQNNADFTDQYLKYLNAKLPGTSLSRSSFVPMCDPNGYFLPAQCDTTVTCWCTSRFGEPVPNSLKKISEDEFTCASE